ncbi:4Fe-4S dicluster domain-containing protein [Candidatus Desulforudis audaxviator]|uniref:4Fe-4S dicluster domain-containing protein n=1 Tax=Candidatus Desulforudis audaxviator TaxID=471827 RepID=UPI00140FDEAE|nr:4Fe-4S dicluster domain-containing protein [Candidatus Desulforudis audaxviator]
MSRVHVLTAKNLWSRDLAAYAGMNRCHQCGVCTAVCPHGRAMDQPPARMVRLLQLGLVDDVLNTEGIWRCVACGQCTDVCPVRVDVRGVIGFLGRLWFWKNILCAGQSLGSEFPDLLAYLGVKHDVAEAYR